jgi:molybdate transport system permease protein
VWPALRLSLQTTSVTVGLTVLLGTPLAWVIARGSGRLAATVETLVHIPMVMPPAVAGVALLLTFGRRGLLSGWAYPEGASVTFTTYAVIMAELFVSAPFYVQAAVSAFRRVEPSLLIVARSFGAHPLRIFFRVAIPLSLPALVAGAAMAWARSLGEFGATLMFAGNLQGQTQTLPLAIYTTLESDLASAQALSIILVAVAFVLLLVVRAMQYRSARLREARP